MAAPLPTAEKGRRRRRRRVIPVAGQALAGPLILAGVLTASADLGGPSAQCHDEGPAPDRSTGRRLFGEGCEPTGQAVGVRVRQGMLRGKHYACAIHYVGLVREVHCAHCELIIGAGCVGHDLGTARRGEGAPMVRVSWTQLSKRTILISPSRVAHYPGACAHMTESDVLVDGSRWGWIVDPPKGTWTRIGEHNPVAANGGRLGISALRRCLDCSESVGLVQ